MERQNDQLSLLGQLANDLGGKRTAEPFRKCDKYTPSNDLAEPLKAMYANNTNKGGASTWPAVMMIKCMMLPRCFNLLDPMLEGILTTKHAKIAKEYLTLPLPFFRHLASFVV